MGGLAGHGEGQRVAVRVRAGEGDAHGPILVGDGGVAVGHRGVVDRVDGERDGGRGAGEGGVADREGERIRAVEVGGRGVGQVGGEAGEGAIGGGGGAGAGRRGAGRGPGGGGEA